MKQRTRTGEQFYRWATIIGFLVVLAFNMLIRFMTSFQRLLFLPAFALLIAVVTIVPVITLGLWAKQGKQPGRRSMAVATFSVGALAVFMQWLAPTVGWWTEPRVSAPVIMLALVRGIFITGVIAGLLVLYRWLTHSYPKIALLAYGILSLALIPFIVFADRFAIESGVIAFQKGYSIWTDVLYGEAIFVLPVLIYETMRRQQAKLTS